MATGTVLRGTWLRPGCRPRSRTSTGRSDRRRNTARAVMPLGVPPHAPGGSAPGEAVGQGGVAPAGAGDADGLADGFRGTDEDDEFLGAGDGGVEQVPLQHQPGAGGD